MANTYKIILLSIGLLFPGNLLHLSASSSAARGIVTIIYGPDENRDHFKIENRDALYSANTLMVTLKKESVDRIVLKSRLKLQESDRANLLTLFKTGNIALKEFWVPISEPPGMIGILTKANPQPEDLTGWHSSKQTALIKTALGSHHFEGPFLVIYQIGADPTMTDPKYNFPFGLVAAVWMDGWIVRARDEDLVGKQYAEGYIIERDFQKFLGEIMSSQILSTPDKTALGMDEPFRVIQLYDGNTKHEWIRNLPEETRPSYIEALAGHLPLESARPAPLKDWKLRQYTEDDL